MKKEDVAAIHKGVSALEHELEVARGDLRCAKDHAEHLTALTRRLEAENERVKKAMADLRNSHGRMAEEERNNWQRQLNASNSARRDALDQLQRVTDEIHRLHEAHLHGEYESNLATLRDLERTFAPYGPGTVTIQFPPQSLKFEPAPEDKAMQAVQEEIYRTILGEDLRGKSSAENRPVPQGATTSPVGFYCTPEEEPAPAPKPPLGPPGRRCSCSAERVRVFGISRPEGDPWPSCTYCGYFISQPKEATVRRMIFRVP